MTKLFVLRDIEFLMKSCNYISHNIYCNGAQPKPNLNLLVGFEAITFLSKVHHWVILLLLASLKMVNWDVGYRHQVHNICKTVKFSHAMIGWETFPRWISFVHFALVAITLYLKNPIDLVNLFLLGDKSWDSSRTNPIFTDPTKPFLL